MTGPADSSSGEGIVCPVCRASLPSDATFCLMCGTRQSAKTTPPVRVNLGREATMLGLVPEAPRTARDTVVDAGPSSPEPPAAQGDVRKVPSQHRTMMGFSATPPPPASQPSAKPHTLTGFAVPPVAGPSPDAKSAGRTMQGVAGITPPRQPPPEGPRARREAPPLVGVVGLADSVRPPADSPRPPPSVRPPPLPPSRGGAVEALEVPGLGPPRRPGRTRLILVATLAVLAIGGISAAVLLRLRSAKPTIAATVIGTASERVRLQVVIPDAAGGQLRVGRETVAIDASGRAVLELLPERVGEVRVPVEVLRGGSSEARELRYFIAWRVEPQLNELGADPSRLLLVFHVPSGATLTVSRQPIRVANGVGIASIEVRDPLPVGDPEGARRYVFPVRVAHTGGVTEGEYTLRVGRTSLRIDEPGTLAASSGTLITVRGTAPRATRVMVGQVAAQVSGETFRADVPLRAGPNTIDVVAWAPGGVPASQRLTVYQGITPEAYLAASPGEHGAAALVAPRDGARVRVRARVLRVIDDGPEGRTMQVVVSDRACPAGQCVLWVDPPRSASVSASQDVDVTGELQGSRAYVAAGGARRSAPVLRALFLQ